MEREKYGERTNRYIEVQHKEQSNTTRHIGGQHAYEDKDYYCSQGNITETKMGTIVMRDEVNRLGGIQGGKHDGIRKGRGYQVNIRTHHIHRGNRNTIQQHNKHAPSKRHRRNNIAQKHTIYPTCLLPESIIRMIPLQGLSERKPSLLLEIATILFSLFNVYYLQLRCFEFGDNVNRYTHSHDVF